ncbi:hypothetical protein BDZ94DRAFT_1003078 [Collybia nuda]|uniref:F-box domain-containing protein n=1 Tax=Collybia nuda TaxID=64659 RepID=A0A9P6CG29_9AGAR|nr:hypothetical protein BDZ94DRAFT_1003078 [Collybia nuda]
MRSINEILPSDVLSAIFKACLAMDNNYASGGTPLVVLNIILVCTTWRKIAAAIPDLWTIIEVNRRTVGMDDYIIRGMAKWISQARHLPISLVFKLRAGEFTKVRLSPIMPWVNLTALELTDWAFDPRETIYILNQAPKMTDLHLIGIGGVPGGGCPYYIAIITHPSLKSLVIEFRSATHLPGGIGIKTVIHPLFHGLILPHLIELEIGASHSAVDYQLLPSLLQLHGRSSFRLARLHLHELLFDVEELKVLLMRLPTLKELHLETRTMYHSFSQLLPLLTEFTPDAHEMILPLLESVFIADNISSEEWNVVENGSLDMLEARMWEGTPGSVSPLKSATLLWGNIGGYLFEAIDGSVTRAKLLVDDGLELVFPPLL